MSVVSDSGPLIHLAAVSHFGLLRHYFSKVLIPSGVYEEVTSVGETAVGNRETEQASQAGWIEIGEIANAGRVNALVNRGLTLTDATVIALAQERTPHFLISDDSNVRIHALSEGLQVIGTIGILIDAKRDGHFSSLKTVLDRLIDFGFYLELGGSLYQQALELAGEI